MWSTRLWTSQAVLLLVCLHAIAARARAQNEPSIRNIRIGFEEGGKAALASPLPGPFHHRRNMEPTLRPTLGPAPDLVRSECGRTYLRTFGHHTPWPRHVRRGPGLEKIIAKNCDSYAAAASLRAIADLNVVYYGRTYPINFTATNLDIVSLFHPGQRVRADPGRSTPVSMKREVRCVNFRNPRVRNVPLSPAFVACTCPS